MTMTMTMTNSDEYARSGDGGKWEEQPPVMFTRDDVYFYLTPDEREHLKLIIEKLRKAGITVTLHTDSDDKGDE